MDQLLLTTSVVLAGVLIAFQSPINAALARGVGSLESVAVSFAVGLVCALVAVGVAGAGSFRGLGTAPWWQFAGGALGMLYVFTFVKTVPRMGVTTVMIAGLAGQLAAALVIDRMGWFGVPVRSLSPARLAAVPLVLFALWLVRR